MKEQHAARAGVKTSEFKAIVLTVISSVLAVVVAVGWLSADESAQVESALVQIIEAIVVLVGVLAPIVGGITYTWSRTRVKEGVLYWLKQKE
jgi:fumarate reductase subunit D